MIGKIVGHGDKTKYYIDGKEVTKKDFKSLYPDKPLGGNASLIGWKPLKSTALAVDPTQVKEAIEDARKKGVPTHFEEDGRPVFTSREHRKQYCIQYGFHDRDAGYSDAQRGSFKGSFSGNEPQNPKNKY